MKVYILAATNRGLYDGITAVYSTPELAEEALALLGRHDGNTVNFIEEAEVIGNQQRPNNDDAIKLLDSFSVDYDDAQREALKAITGVAKDWHDDGWFQQGGGI